MKPAPASPSITEMAPWSRRSDGLAMTEMKKAAARITPPWKPPPGVRWPWMTM